VHAFFLYKEQVMSISINIAKGLEIKLDLSLSTIDKDNKLLSVTNNGSQIIWVFEKSIVTDKLSIENNFLSIGRNIKILKNEDYCISFKISSNLEDTEVFCPGVIFKRNKAGTGCYPRISYSKSWSFDESRMNIPGCISIFNEKEIFISATRSSKFRQSASFLMNQVTYRIPSEEWPSTYNGKNISYFSSDKRNKTYKTFQENSEINLEYLIYFAPFDNLDGYKYTHIFDQYKKFAKTFFLSHKKDENQYLSWWDFKALAIVGLLNLLHRDSDGTYILMGKDNENHQQYYNYTSGSFLVKSLEGACVLAKLDVNLIKTKISKPIRIILEETEDRVIPLRDYKEVAKEIGNFFLKAEGPSGIFRDTYNFVDNEWTSYYGKGSRHEHHHAINTRTCGEAMLSYIKLSEMFPHDISKDYQGLVERVSDFFIHHQKESGNYGRWFDEKGNLMNDLGCNGSHILRLFITLYKKTNNMKYLDSIKKAIPYYSNMIKRGYYFGDTLDADCMDKEAGVILLNSFLHLYEIPEFKTDATLELCKDAANYVSTWIVLDDIKFKENTPLGRRNFKTTGLSSVSISNAHLDFYGMIIAYDFLKLHKYSNDVFYKDMAVIMIKACRKLISNPNDLLGRSKDFYGWIPEQINHTHWDYFNNTNHIDGYFGINIAWTQILILDYLSKIQVNFKEIFDNMD
jgi:hypothetical protein